MSMPLHSALLVGTQQKLQTFCRLDRYIATSLFHLAASAAGMYARRQAAPEKLTTYQALELLKFDNKQCT
jgi:hypothetical protein